MGIVYEDCYHYLLNSLHCWWKISRGLKNFTSFSENFTNFSKLHQLFQKLHQTFLKKTKVFWHEQNAFWKHFLPSFPTDWMNEPNPERKLIKLPFTFHKYRKPPVHRGLRVKATNFPLNSFFHAKSRWIKGFSGWNVWKQLVINFFVENIFVYLDRTRKRLSMFTNIFAPYYQIQLKQKRAPEGCPLY